MSNKAECPGCNSYTSSVLRADEEGEPCPYCGLSAGARAEILTVRRKRADEKLRTRVEELVKECDKLTRENGRLRRFTANVRMALNGIDREDDI